MANGQNMELLDFEKRRKRYNWHTKTESQLNINTFCFDFGGCFKQTNISKAHSTLAPLV